MATEKMTEIVYADLIEIDIRDEGPVFVYLDGQHTHTIAAPRKLVVKEQGHARAEKFRKANKAGHELWFMRILGF
jgi:hypothetical protein